MDAVDDVANNPLTAAAKVTFHTPQQILAVTLPEGRWHTEDRETAFEAPSSRAPCMFNGILTPIG